MHLRILLIFTACLGSSALGASATCLDYMRGVYAPIAMQTVAPIELQVIGKIPEEVAGAYLRNGPNPLHTDYAAGTHHWFDGDGMLQKINIVERRAYYQSRYVQTQGLTAEQDRGQRLFTGLTELGVAGTLQKALAALRNSVLQSNTELGRAGIFKDTANTDLVSFRGKLIALWWLAGKPYALDPETLETIGVENFQNTYSGDVAAHARVDESTGELFFLNFGQLKNFVSVNAVGADGKLKWSQKFDLPYARIYHDILFTKDYVLLLDFPLGFTKDSKTGKNGIGFDSTSPNGYSRIVLIDRHNPAIKREVRFPATYVLHGLNAFQENGNVTLIVTKFLDPLARPDNFSDQIPLVGTLRVETVTARWDIDAQNNLRETIVDPRNTEFARINDGFLGRKSRYSYHPLLVPGPTVLFSGLRKIDLLGGRAVDLEYGPNLVGEEAIFIPRKGAKSEDDGWVATLVHDLTTLKCEFRIYEAASMDKEPVARILIPTHIPYGFHAKWVESNR